MDPAADTMVPSARAGAGGAAALERALRRRTGRPLVVVLTDNRHRLVSRIERGGVTTVRLHRRFAVAPEAVVEAVGGLLAADGPPAEARALVRAWWRGLAADGASDGGDFPEWDGEGGDAPAGTETASVRPAPPSAAAGEGDRVNVPGVTARGRCHDLAEYARHLNAAYLDGRSKASVRWGPRPRARGPTRTIRLGCYCPGRGRIIMNRRLDRPDIPRYFVEYVLFHEMLHEVLGIGERPDGRRDIHGSLFKLMERTYPGADRALAFERRYFGGEG